MTWLVVILGYIAVAWVFHHEGWRGGYEAGARDVMNSFDIYRPADKSPVTADRNEAARDV